LVIAYDRPVAGLRFGLIVGGATLGYWFARAPERVRLRPWGDVSPVRVMLSVLPTLVAIFFLLTNDWGRWDAKLGWLDPLRRWFAAWQPALPGIRLNPNVAGGIIAAFLPLQAAAWQEGSRSRRSIWLGSLLLGLSGMGLLMSASRGAWLALAAALSGWALWELSGWIARRRTTAERGRIQTAIWAGSLVTGIVFIALVLALTPWGTRLLAWPGERPAIWRNSRDLLGDYLFTGLGLGGFPMAYSSYVLLVHVGYIAHAHNLFLDVWLEQGVPGIIALLWLLGTAFWSVMPASRWRPAALAALAVILLHGLVDDAFYGYGGWGVLLLFVPFGVLARVREAKTATSVGGPAAERTNVRTNLVRGSLVALLLGATFLVPQMQSVFLANLGALAQTQAELSVYRWPQWPIQDSLRRSSDVNLTRAIAYYRAALAIDPANATANRRLGQIELARGDYDASCRHLQAAYAAAENQRAVRQLWGECLALSGDIQAAATLWQTVDMSQQQLELRQWWYWYLGEQERAARIAAAERVLFGRS
jgi:hypothetical protein